MTARADIARYLCCRCDADVTPLVRRAFEERLFQVRMITMHHDDSVTVTCVNGHTCAYTNR